MTVSRFLLIPLVSLICLCVSCTGNSYDSVRADDFAQKIDEGAVLDQSDYSEMVQLLDNGYEYLRDRIARAAFENDPNAAVKDLIEFMDDSTLKSIQRNSRIFIDALEKAPLSSKTETKFRKIAEKYRMLDNSLRADSLSIQ